MRTLFLLVGPSCTGKSTIEKWLNANGMPSVVSFTTRTPRTGEVEGKDYYFLDRAAVQVEFDADAVVQSVNFNGNIYGTTKECLAIAFAASDRAVVVVEPTGVTQYQLYAEKHDPDLAIVPVYINNTMDTLTNRLINRYRGDANGDPAYYWRRQVGIQVELSQWPHWPGIKWAMYFHTHDDQYAGGMFSTSRLGTQILQYRARK